MDDARPKPLVVLVPDVMEWVLGSWAREIADANADLYDFIIFPASQFESAPEQLTEALNNADLIHCLAQSGSGLDEIRGRVKAVGSESLPIISSIHHIVRLEDVAACLNADAIVVVCNEVREKLVASGVPDAKIHTVRKGVDTRFFVRRDPAAARHRLGIDPHDFVVGFSAKASSDDRGRKGLDIFHRVVTRLPEIVGGPVTVALTGPGWETLGAGVRIPGLQWRHAPFLDPEVMPDFYSAIDVYLSTARIEGGPVPAVRGRVRLLSWPDLETSAGQPIACEVGIRDLKAFQIKVLPLKLFPLSMGR